MLWKLIITKKNKQSVKKITPAPLGPWFFFFFFFFFFFYFYLLFYLYGHLGLSYFTFKFILGFKILMLILIQEKESVNTMKLRFSISFFKSGRLAKYNLFIRLNIYVCKIILSLSSLPVNLQGIDDSLSDKLEFSNASNESVARNINTEIETSLKITKTSLEAHTPSNTENVCSVKTEDKALRLIAESETVIPSNDNLKSLILSNLKEQIFNNFNDLSQQEMKDYVKNKIYLKGLNSNNFLVDYFVSAILNNTKGSQIDADNFLNTNLNILINQQRNIQLNSHSFARVRPFLINNHLFNLNTGLSSLIPYKENLELKAEWEEILREEINSRKDVEDSNSLSKSTDTNDQIQKKNIQDH
jgi:hypothetical protein